MEFSITGYEIFEELRFILELLIVEFIVAIPMSKKRSKFYLRAAIGAVVCIGYAMCYFLIRYALNSYEAYNKGIIVSAVIIGHYCLLTVLTTIYMYTIFRTPLAQAVLYTIIGYSVQHMSYVLFTELIARTWFTGITNYLYLYVLVAVVGFGLLCVALYFAFLKNFANLEYISLGDKKRTFISYTAMLLVTVFLAFAGQSVYQNGGGDRIVSNPNYLGAAVSLLTCGIMLFTLCLLFVDNQKTKEKEMINQLFYEQTKQYDMKKESVETVKRLAHDMKHQILALKSETDDKNKILENMQEEIEGYDYHVETGNEAVNVIIFDKNISNLTNNIRIDFDGDGSLISFMETPDIYVLLGNALDNAVEAILRSNVENKNISLSIKSAKGIVSLYVSNYYDGKIHMKDGNIKTRKKDDVLHGIGLKSMRRIVEKYDGRLDVSVSDNIFTLKAMFIR